MWRSDVQRGRIREHTTRVRHSHCYPTARVAVGSRVRRVPVRAAVVPSTVYAVARVRRMRAVSLREFLLQHSYSNNSK